MSGALDPSGRLTPDPAVAPSLSVSGPFSADPNFSRGARLQALINGDTAREVCSPIQEKTVGQGGSTSLSLSADQCTLRLIPARGSNFVVTFLTSFGLFNSDFTSRVGGSVFRFEAIYERVDCPAGILQGSSQACPPARLSVDTKADVLAGETNPVEIKALKQDGMDDTSFNGTIRVSLAAGSTPKIGCLRAGGLCAPFLSLPMAGGKLTQPLSLQTPEQELTPNSVIKIGDTALEGKAIVRAEVEQATGVAAQKEVTVGSPLDLMIDRIEAQQGVKQGPEGLWAGERDLLVRIFLKANREGPDSFDKYSAIQGITAKLIVKDKSGSEIIGSPFTLSKGGIRGSSLPGIGSFNAPVLDYVFVPDDSPAADGSDSLNHILGGTFEQQLNLEVKLDDAIPDRNRGNNSASYAAPLNFGVSRPVSVLYARLRILGGEDKTEFPTRDGIDREMEFIKLAWPIASRSLKFVELPDEVQTTVPLAGSDPFTFRNRAIGIGFWISAARGIRYVYFVDRNYFPFIREKDLDIPIIFPKPSGGGTNGLTNILINVSVVDSNRCATNKDKCGVLAHELGHQFGLEDTYVNSNTNPKRGNPVEPGNFTWFHHEFVGGASPFGSPIPYVEFMGNGGLDGGYGSAGVTEDLRTWVDLFTWNHLKSRLLFAPQSSQTQRTEARAAGNFVIVQGTVNKNGSARLNNCYTLTLTEAENTPTSGNYVIETLDANSAVISSLNFTPEFRLPHLDLEREQSDFNFALPFSSAVRQIRLRLGANVLASRAVSANDPTARFVSDFSGLTLTGTQQVSWAGSDPDGDALTYDLFYSPDGQLRIPLTETTATSFAWKTDDYSSSRAGPTPTLTLVATDGVNATVVDSRPFILPNRPPRISIFSPGDQFQFKVGEPITFAGSFFDPEEDINLNPQLQWSSNIQGALGIAKEITVNNLQAGTHVITASGADSQGARGSASVTVIIRPDNFSNIEAAPVSIDFGGITVGQTKDLRLSMRNTGNAAFTVNAITSDNPRFSLIVPAAPFTVAARSQRELTVRFTPLTAGAQTGALTIASNASNRPSVIIPLTGNATGVAARAVATVSAASFSGATLAREAIVAAFGVSLATATQAANSLPLPVELAGTTVRVRDSAGEERLAPLFFVSPGQINYQIPLGTTAGAATVIATSGAGALSIGDVTIAAVAPGVFTANQNGQGVPAALVLRVKADGTQSFESVLRFDAARNQFVATPIDLGPDLGDASDQVFLILFGTGWRFRSALSAVTCDIGGVNSEVSFAGEQSEFVGLDQMNVRLARSLAGRGEMDVKVTVDGKAANTVRISVK